MGNALITKATAINSGSSANMIVENLLDRVITINANTIIPGDSRNDVDFIDEQSINCSGCAFMASHVYTENSMRLQGKLIDRKGGFKLEVDANYLEFLGNKQLFYYSAAANGTSIKANVDAWVMCRLKGSYGVSITNFSSITHLVTIGLAVNGGSTTILNDVKFHQVVYGIKFE